MATALTYLFQASTGTICFLSHSTSWPLSASTVLRSRSSGSAFIRRSYEAISSSSSLGVTVDAHAW